MGIKIYPIGKFRISVFWGMGNYILRHVALPIRVQIVKHLLDLVPQRSLGLLFSIRIVIAAH